MLNNDSFAKLYGSNVKKFREKTTAKGLFVPVLECMLLYEMPENIVPHNDSSDIEDQVWVGIRQLSTWSGKHKYTTRYLTVPSRVLVSAAKLELVGASLAIFQSISSSD